ncbi:aminotransferase class I/II-fold pyridoxal phosphate-dependent enzyme [Sphingomonas sp. CJ99]
MAMARVPVHPFAVHGGRIDLARATMPDVDEWTDLSTGIAPWPYPMTIDAAGMTALPDPADLSRLEALAAKAFGAPGDRVMAVPGSDLALRLIGLTLGGPAEWLAPGYSGHRAMWPTGQGRPFDRHALPSLANGDGHVVLARPNNPDGWVADRAVLIELAGQLAGQGRWLIVDEAFADAGAGDSLAACDAPGLVVLRSFGKFFGLAGLRLGFVIAPPDLVRQLRALIGDWPVSGPALSAGLAAYADRAWQADQRARLNAGARRMAALFGEHGLAIIGQTPFFTLIEHVDRDALFAHLLCHGVLSRPFADEPCWLRLGLPGTESDWARLEKSLADWSAR